MEFDTIIIGSGVAGIAAAKKLAKSGQKTAIIESWDWGGTVVHRGSTSKKIYLAASEVKQAAEHMINHGISQIPPINWPALTETKNTMIATTEKKLLAELDSLNITRINGQATFINEKEIRVENEVYTATHFIVATGARPRSLDIIGKEHFLYSGDFLNLSSMPRDLIIVGAGIIAFAFASIANAAGANVHILQHDDRALAAFDQDLVQELIQILKDRGVHFHFNEPISEITPTTTEQYHIKTSNGLSLITDKVFCVAGRIPNVEDLGLDAAGIQYTAKGIEVNDHLQSNVEHIYAIGDCNNAPVPKLANYAVLQGHYVADYLIGIDKDQPIGTLNYPVPSMSVFSNPKLALAGMSTVEAYRQPDKYEVHTIDMSQWLPYLRFQQPVALAKIVIEKSSQTVIGITSLSDQADVLINYMTLVLNQKISKEELANYLFAYPTLATNLHQLMDGM